MGYFRSLLDGWHRGTTRRRPTDKRIQAIERAFAADAKTLKAEAESLAEQLDTERSALRVATKENEQLWHVIERNQARTEAETAEAARKIQGA